MFTSDLLEGALGTNQGDHLWTITKFEANEPVDPANNPLAATTFLQEMCSINILLTSEDCVVGLNLRHLFGPRLFDTRNMMIILIGSRVKCSPPVFVTLITLLPVTINVLFLSPGDQEVQLAVDICMTCGTKNKVNQARPAHLKLLQIWSEKAQRESMEPIAAFLVKSMLYFAPERVKKCERWYSKRSPTQSALIGCVSEHLFMEIAAERLNLSVEYIPPEIYVDAGYFMESQPMPKDFTVVAFFMRQSWLGGLDPYTSIDYTSEAMEQVLVEQDTCSFVYCTKSTKRKALR